MQSRKRFRTNLICENVLVARVCLAELPGAGVVSLPKVMEGHRLPAIPEHAAVEPHAFDGLEGFGSKPVVESMPYL
jgi:hypothetical protein